MLLIVFFHLMHVSQLQKLAAASGREHLQKQSDIIRSAGKGRG